MLRVIDAETLAGRLTAAGVDDVRTDGTTRAIYSSDASLYRVPPLLVAAPRNADEVAAVLAVCRAEGVPLTARGAGTSIAGNAVGTGVVLDFSRHMNRVLAGGSRRGDGDRATGCRAGGPAACGGAVRAAVRPGPVVVIAVHAGRHDRQQRLRHPRAGLWANQ